MGKAIELQYPEKAEQALALIGNGLSFKAIARQTGFDCRTISRLAARNQETVDQWRTEAAAKAKEVAGMVLERIYDQAADPETDVSFKDLTISYGILTDKSLVLSDQPTSITETRQGVDMDAARSAIEAAQKRIQGEAIDV